MVSESSGGGTDSVLTSVSEVTLTSDVEWLILNGTVAVGTGNSLNNTLVGNSAANTLSGGAGNDSMSGAAGNDYYIIDSTTDVVSDSAGVDSVFATITGYTLGLGADWLILDSTVASGAGNSIDNTIVGNAISNTIFGAEGNDSITGGGGNDSMIGGTGDDYYIVDSTLDGVYEAASSGIDSILAQVTDFYLNSNTEWLILDSTIATGTGNSIDNTLIGNSVANTLAGGLGNDSISGDAGNDSISGGADNDSLTGGAGDDTLAGGTGNDSLVGGAGNDYYFVDTSSDSVVETASEGVDSILSSFNGYTLAENVEWLIFDSTISSGTGNSLANTIIGNSFGNTLDGGTGADSMVGGNGNDYYVVDNLGDVVLESSLGGNSDTIFININGYVVPSHIENITFGESITEETGNSLNNILVGNSLNNTLDGAAGADTLIGGDGNDIYIVDNVGDVATELNGASSGTDSVRSNIGYYALGNHIEYLTLGTGAVTGAGNSLDNTLIGNSGPYNSLFGGAGHDWLDGSSQSSGKNTLNGGTGSDTMIGSAQNDYFVIDHAGDSIVGGGGTDGIISEIDGYTLQVGFNALTLRNGATVGSGNSVDNSLTGNDLNNTLDGGDGNDTMLGGIGNDYYLINSAADMVIESAGYGTDTIEAIGINSYTLAANTEKLILGTGAVNGTGTSLNNTLAGNSTNNILNGGSGNDSVFGNGGNDSLEGGIGNDTLVGGSDSDTLSGGAGNDSLSGGSGNDYYIVDSTLDSIVENSNNGIDSVRVDVTGWTLGASQEVEWIILNTGTSSTGNSFSNTLIGNSAANTLAGGAGNDSLAGGNGNDSLAGGEGNDTILGEVGNNTLNGGMGNDSLVGSIGNDYYFIDSSSDFISDTGGVDSVFAQFTGYSLLANFEYLILDPTLSAGSSGIGNASANTLVGNSVANTLSGGNGNDSISGGAGDDTLLGDAGNDTLLGGDGNDSLIGGAGIDVMAGGAGNDFYIVDTSLDVVTENSAAGTDSVLVNFTGYQLANNVEWLVIGTALSVTGNSLANTLVGNTGNELLVGNGGNDSIIGNGGNDKLQGANAATFGRNEKDTLTGGSGNDQFVLGAATGAFYNDGLASNAGNADYALITDFTTGGDSLVLKGSAAVYYIGTHTVSGVAGVGLFLETGAIDELIAIIQNSGTTSNTSNTVANALFV